MCQKRGNPGPCGGSSGVATLHVTVKGCDGSALIGATVTATQGSTTVTGTTVTGTGYATLSLPTVGTWSISGTESSGRSVGGTTTQAVVSGGTYAVNVTISAASGYVCALWCQLPVPAANFTLTDPQGTVTLTYYGGGSPYWQSAFVTRNLTLATKPTIGPCYLPCTAQSMSVQYTLHTGAFLYGQYLTMSVYPSLHCSGSTNDIAFPGPGTSGTTNNAVFVAVSNTCDPVAFSGAFPTTNCTDVFGGGTVSFHE